MNKEEMKILLIDFANHLKRDMASGRIWSVEKSVDTFIEIINDTSGKKRKEAEDNWNKYNPHYR